jgi:hypothetical protein
MQILLKHWWDKQRHSWSIIRYSCIYFEFSWYSCPMNRWLERTVTFQDFCNPQGEVVIKVTAQKWTIHSQIILRHSLTSRKNILDTWWKEICSCKLKKQLSWSNRTACSYLAIYNYHITGKYFPFQPIEIKSIIDLMFSVLGDVKCLKLKVRNAVLRK